MVQCHYRNIRNKSYIYCPNYPLKIPSIHHEQPAQNLPSKKKNQPKISHFSLLKILLLVLIFTTTFDCTSLVYGGKAKIHIPDELDDVIDDEEDEAWREWGKKKSEPEEFDPPPDFSKMELSQIQAEMMKRQTGPAFGFVKLRPGVKRTVDMVAEIAMKWTKVLRTGAVEVKFTGIDLRTVMFSMENGQDSSELKEFILSQPEAYEIKIGDQVSRRPGNPPLEELAEQLQRDKSKLETNAVENQDDDNKDEL